MHALKGTGRGVASAKFTRRPPSQAEQARREAWGHKYGPLVGQSIRDAIRKQG